MRNLSFALTATLAIALQIEDDETQRTYEDGFNAGFESAQNYQSGYEDGFTAGQLAAEEAQSSNPANALSTEKYLWTQDDSGAGTCEKSITVVLLDDGITLDPVVTTEPDGDACCSAGIDAGLTRPLINACEQTTTLAFTGG